MMKTARSRDIKAWGHHAVASTCAPPLSHAHAKLAGIHRNRGDCPPDGLLMMMMVMVMVMVMVMMMVMMMMVMTMMSSTV